MPAKRFAGMARSYSHKMIIVNDMQHLFNQEPIMPYVNIRIAETLSREQKARIAAEITDTLERIALKPKSYT